MPLGPEFQPQFSSPQAEFLLRVDNLVDHWLDEQTQSIEDEPRRFNRRDELRALFVTTPMHSIVDHPELVDIHRNILALSVSVFGIQGFSSLLDQGRRLSEQEE